MAIKDFTRWANAHGFLKVDPGAQFKTPRLKRVLPVLPPFEVMEGALAAEPSLRNRVILVIGLYGGLRAEEIWRSGTSRLRVPASLRRSLSSGPARSPSCSSPRGLK